MMSMVMMMSVVTMMMITMMSKQDSFAFVTFYYCHANWRLCHAKGDDCLDFDQDYDLVYDDNTVNDGNDSDDGNDNDDNGGNDGCLKSNSC